MKAPLLVFLLSMGWISAEVSRPEPAASAATSTFPRPSWFIPQKVGRDPFGTVQPGKLINRSLPLLKPRRNPNVPDDAKPRLEDFFTVSTISMGRYDIAVINRFAFATGEYFQFNHPDSGLLLIKIAEIADGLVRIECEGQLHTLPITRRDPVSTLRRAR